MILRRAYGGLNVLRTQALAFWEIWPLAGLALAMTLVYLRAPHVIGLPYDDSYISLTFARNLAEHGFLTFDGREASAGATSVLHVAVLAVPIKLGLSPVHASLAAGIVAQIGLVLATYWLAWTIFRDRLTAALAGFSIAVMGYVVADALNGMETSLFLLVSTAAAAALFGARNERGMLAAGVLAALAVLCRPEGGLLVAAMGLYYAVDPERAGPLLSPGSLRRLILLGAPALLTLVALSIFYGAATGSLAPGTASAKLQFFREFDAPLRIRFDMTLAALGNFSGPVLPWLALAGYGASRRQALVFAFFWCAFFVLYLMLFPGGLGHYWYRYMHVFLPPIAVFASAGAVSLLRGRSFRAWDVVPIALIGSMLAGAMVLQYNSFRNHYADDVTVNEQRQVGLARYLSETVPPGDTIATHDIGAIGYFSGRELIDLVGLINPDAVDYHDGRRLREYVDSVQPDYIVVLPSWEDRYLQLGLTKDPALFELIAVFDTPGREPFIVYRTHYESRLPVGVTRPP